MQKVRLNRVVFVFAFFFLVKGGGLFAQSKFLEFKSGFVASSPFYNPEVGKKFIDFQQGISLSVCFGYEYPNEIIRLYAEISYVGKGDNYPSQEFTKGKYNLIMNYFEISPQIRSYFLSGLFYFSCGFYSGYCFNSGFDGELLSENQDVIKITDNYKKIDFGPKASLGVELGMQNIRGCIEVSYEYGLSNISKLSSQKITNQALFLSLGIDFKILQKNFRRF